MDVDDALNVIVTRLRRHPDGYDSHGYEVDLLSLLAVHLSEQHGKQLANPRENPGLQELSVPFYAAAWELCRQGILRPGVKMLGGQTTNDGAGGAGFAITPMGRRWLLDDDGERFALLDPLRRTEVLAGYAERFGPGFAQRGLEAIRCYQAAAYLACCAMCGAAAESVLLAAAIARAGEEKAVLESYRSANGRRKAENKLVGKADEALAARFRAFTGLIDYWHDERAHAAGAETPEIEAYDALGRLLHFAHFADENWETLTSKG